ncbi:hypothetical protein Aperf_G00000100409 [Anoplocephala perfoliata]
MDFSVSQFSGDANISDSKVSPLALIKNGYSNTDTDASCVDNPESAELFSHLPTNMYANIVSSYTRSEDFSRSYLPYAQINPTMTTSSDGMSFFPYVEPIHHQQQIDENEHLKAACSSNQMPTNATRYYPSATQAYAAENELITNVGGNYKYETLNTFKDSNEEGGVLRAQMDETLSEWETDTAVAAAVEGIVQSAEISRASIDQTYSTGAGNEGLLDCSNRSSASKSCNEIGGEYCAIDRSISQDQQDQHHVLSVQQFQEPPGIYVTQTVHVPEEQQLEYPPNVACTQSTLLSTMVPYQCPAGYTGDLNSVHMERMMHQNLDPYTGEMTGSHQVIGMNPDALENSQSQYPYAESASVEGWPGFPKDLMTNFDAQDHADLGQMSDCEELNTKELAQRVSAELKRYSIPQAIFAQRVLCRSQGTLSDLLRNPKPWSKLKSGRETFRRMWKWLQEPEYQRMSALRLAGKYLQNATNKRKEEMITGMVQGDIRVIKKPRLVFTDIQRRTLHAIFKETKRPSKEMQATIANQLGLEISTVANFFMNARRRSLEKWQDCEESKTSSMLDSSSPQSSADPSESLLPVNEDSISMNHPGDGSYDQTGMAGYAETDQNSLYASSSMVSCQTPSQMYMTQLDYSFPSAENVNQQESRMFPYARPDTSSVFQTRYFGHYPIEQPEHALQQTQQTSSSLIDLRRLASASQIDPRFLATATEFSASHQSLRDQALEICSNMAAAAAAAAAGTKFGPLSEPSEAKFLKQEAEPIGEAGDDYLAQRLPNNHQNLDVDNWDIPLKDIILNNSQCEFLTNKHVSTSEESLHCPAEINDKVYDRFQQALNLQGFKSSGSLTSSSLWRLQEELHRKTHSIKDLEQKYVKVTAQLETDIQEARAKNRALEDALRNKQEVLNRVTADRDSVQKDKFTLTLRLQVVEDQLREVEHRLNSRVLGVEVEKARLMELVEEVRAISERAEDINSRIQRTLSDADLFVPHCAASNNSPVSAINCLLTYASQLLKEFQEVLKQRDDLRIDNVKQEVSAAKSKSKEEILSNEVEKYANECRRLTKLLEESRNKLTNMKLENVNLKGIQNETKILNLRFSKLHPCKEMVIEDVEHGQNKQKWHRHHCNGDDLGKSTEIQSDASVKICDLSNHGIIHESNEDIIASLSHRIEGRHLY